MLTYLRSYKLMLRNDLVYNKWAIESAILPFSVLLCFKF